MIVMDQAMNLLEKLVDELKEAPPEKRDHFMKVVAGFVELGMEAFRTNPDFRKELIRITDQELHTYLQRV